MVPGPLTVHRKNEEIQKWWVCVQGLKLRTLWGLGPWDSAFASASYTSVSFSLQFLFLFLFWTLNSSSGFLLPYVLAILLMARNWILRELRYFSVLGWSVLSCPVARLTSTLLHRGLRQEGETCVVDQQREVVKFCTISVWRVSGVVLQSLTAEANLSRSSLWWYTGPS